MTMTEEKKNIIEGRNGNRALTLSEAAEGSKYTRAYISFAVRTGKMKGMKIRGKWHTTRGWLEEFTRKAEEEKIARAKAREKYAKEIIYINSDRDLVSPASARERENFGVQENSRETFSQSMKKWAGVLGSTVNIAVLVAVAIIAFQLSKNKDERKGGGQVAGTMTVGQMDKKQTGLEQAGGKYAGGKLSAIGEGLVLAEMDAKESKPEDLDVSVFITGNGNQEITNGDYEVRFALYTVDRTEVDPYPSDADQSQRVWEETKIVTIENGLLKTFLGNINPLPADLNFAEKNFYLGIRVERDSEMVPRKKIGSVPLSRMAMNALTAQTISG